MIELLVLGPVEIRADGKPIKLLQPRQQHALAALLVDVNRPVPWATLVDRVWGSEPPDAARTAMRAHVSRIRQALRAADDRTGRPARLLRGGGGYELQADPDQIDLHRWRRLAQQAQATTAGDGERVRLLREAVGLWRGEPLAGLPGEWAGRVRSAWQHERLDVVAAWASAELAIGNATAVIVTLGELTEEYPLVESVAAVYVRALHAAGRTAEAIDRYLQTSHRLADEIGVSPGADLSSAHQSVLREGPVAPPPPIQPPPIQPPPIQPPPIQPPPKARVPAQLPLDVRGFVGRASHLERLDELLHDSVLQPTAMPIALIRGTAGVGKTALAVHWAHQIAGRFPDGQLYLNLRGFDPVGPPMDPAEAVRRCLTALDVPARRMPADLDARAALCRSELAGRRMLIVLDNAHDAAQVRPLLPGTPRCLVVVTSRDKLTGLVVAEAAHPIDLDLLSTDEAAQLLGRRLGADRMVNEWQAVTGIIDRCARLPLALAIAAANAAARPRSPLAVLAGELSRARDRLDALAGDDPNTDLRAVLAHSYDALSAPAQRLFRLLSLHPGQDIGRPATASLAALPPTETDSLLAELTEATLLTEHTPGRYTYHDLLRVYAAELAAAVDQDRGEALVRILDHCLHTAHAADRQLYPTRDPIALGRPRPGTVPEVFANERQAFAWFAVEHATMLAAVEQAAANRLDTHTWQLVWTLYTFFGRGGHWAELAAANEIALATAVRLDDPAVQARSHHQLGTTCTRLGRFADAERELHLALEQYGRIGNRVGQARAHHHMSYLFERQHRPDRSLAHAVQALELYRAAGHRNGEAHALNGVGWYSAQTGDNRTALPSCQQALTLFQELDDRPGQAVTLDSLGYIHHGLGDHAEAIGCYHEALALLHALGNRFNEANTLIHLGDVHRTAGDVDVCRTAWLQALTIFTELRHPDTRQLRARIDGLPATTPEPDGLAFSQRRAP